MDDEPARIRQYRASDLDALYQVCLQTADHGQDATPQFRDPWLPGHVYAAPYGLFEPALAFVAADSAGVGGYVVAALDSRAFGQRLDRDWWPRLRGRYPEPPPGIPEQQWTPDQRVSHSIHVPWRVPADLAVGYPSHLHINLLPRLQGRGNGRALIGTLTEALRARGSPGLHLHVSRANRRAAQFYAHMGFTELPAGGTRVFAMDLRRPG